MINIKSFICGCCQTDSTRADDKVSIVVSKRPQQATSKTETTKNEATLRKNLKPASDGVLTAPWLILKPVEGNILPLDRKIKIGPLGITENGRQQADGITFFGSQKYIVSDKDSEKSPYNDVVLNDPTVGSRHCMIKYDPASQSYYLKDLGDGSGTFVKVDQETALKTGYIISFADSHILLSISRPSSNSKENENIVLKFLDGPKADEVYTFRPTDKLIRVGRVSDCEIKFDVNTLSRYQFTIVYKESKGWVVIDGYDGKQSTNGTWLFVEDYYEISQNIAVKIGQTLFKVTLDR